MCRHRGAANRGRGQAPRLPLKGVRAQPTSPPSEFPSFCEAVRAWLHGAVCLDPALAAVADLVERTSPDITLRAEQQVASLAGEAADMHAVLGASALLSLWDGVREVG